MKLYSNYSRKEWIGFGLTIMFLGLSVYVPTFYVINDLFVPFSNASSEFIKFAVEDGFLDRWANYYYENQTLSNLDKPSFILFNVLTFIGGIVIPAFVLMLFLWIIPANVLYLCRRFKLITRKNPKISRKEIE